jgi:hypothetical protein
MITQYSIQAVDANDATEPVTVEETKAFMRVDYTDDDSVIERLIKSARRLIGRKLNRVLVKSNVTLTVSSTYGSEPIGLYYYSNASLFTLTDVDTDEALAIDEYAIKDNVLRVDYAGLYSLTWTETPDVGEDIKEAIKMLVAYRYNNRGDQEKQQGMPLDVQEIINQNYVPCL